MGNISKIRTCLSFDWVTGSFFDFRCLLLNVEKPMQQCVCLTCDACKC